MDFRQKLGEEKKSF